MNDIFLEKLEQDLPKYPYYITNWNVSRYDEDGDPLNENDYRYTSPKNDIELHLEKREHLEFFYSENSVEKHAKIDVENYTFYNIKNRKSIPSDFYFSSIHYNYYRKDGPARLEKSYNYKKKLTSYYCRWYPNLKGLMNRQNGPASYRVAINEKSEFEVISYEWMKNNSIRHRIGAPAVYSFNKYKWYLEGFEYSSYKYWLMMLEKYPSKYKIVSEDDAKIIISSKSHAPSILYKKNKNTVWKLNDKVISMKKYWDAQVEQHLYVLE